MKDFFKKIGDYVLEAENVYLDGASKKEFVINSLNALIDIPVIPEVLERKILDILVDLTVYLFNSYGPFKKPV